MSAYSEKLKDPRWQKKRLEILQRDEFMCCYCCDETTELQVHHRKYTKEPWDAPNEDLVSLCKHCHVYIGKYPNNFLLTIGKDLYKDFALLRVYHLSENAEDRVVSIYKVIDCSIELLLSFKEGSEIHKSLLNVKYNG